MHWSRISLFSFLLITGFCSYSQIVPEFLPQPETKATYLFFGLSIPLRTHLDKEARINNNTLLPDGLTTNFGAGFHYNRWLGIGIHSSTAWRISEKLVTVPVYANLRIAPEINEDYRIFLQPGYGYAFAIGHGGLSGGYKKISLGLNRMIRSASISYSNNMVFHAMLPGTSMPSAWDWD